MIEKRVEKDIYLFFFSSYFLIRALFDCLLLVNARDNISLLLQDLSDQRIKIHSNLLASKSICITSLHRII